MNGQQIDLRSNNSWRLKLEEVPLSELAEVMAINAIAPFVLNAAGAFISAERGAATPTERAGNAPRSS